MHWIWLVCVRVSHLTRNIATSTPALINADNDKHNKGPTELLNTIVLGRYLLARAGKSTILQTVALELAETKRLASSFHFFSPRQTGCQTSCWQVFSRPILTTTSYINREGFEYSFSSQYAPK